MKGRFGALGLLILLGTSPLAATGAAAPEATPASASATGQPSDREFLQTVLHGKAFEVRALLARGANVHATGPNGEPTIAYAILSKNPETLDVLLRADPTLAKGVLKDSKGVVRSPLLVAVGVKQPEMVDLLIRAGADVDWANPDGVTALALTVPAASPESAKLLLEAHADPNRRDIHGRTPLASAAGAGNLEIARLLLEHGAWTYPLDTTGHAAIGYARGAIKDPATSKAMVDLLLGHGAPADGKIRPIDATYLDAVHRGDLPAVEAALAHGADVNARRAFTLDNALSEPTSLAVKHPKVLAYLIEHGVDIHAANEYGFTALFIAAGRDGNRESLEYLVAHGLDVNSVSRNGATPLYDAVNQNLPSTVELLLRLGARADVKSPSGMTLLDMARLPNHSALIAPMLEKAGASPSPADAPAPCVITTSHVLPCALPELIRIGNDFLVIKALDGGADVNGRDAATGRSLLAIALALPAPKTNLGVAVPDDEATRGLVRRRLHLAHYLLDHGADVRVADNQGFTALHVVASEPRAVEVIDTLIRKGAPLDGPAGSARGTPLFLAIGANNTVAAEALLRAGADPNVTIEKGQSPLMSAAYLGQAAVSRLLVEKGAKLDAKSEAGVTPLKSALLSGSVEIAAYLLKSGANPDFDGGVAPSPRQMSRGMKPEMQALFAPAGGAP